MPLRATSSRNRCKNFCIPTWKIRKMQSFSSTYMLTSFLNLTKISFKIGNNHIVVIWHFVRESRGWKIQFILIFDLLSFCRKKFYNFRIRSRPDWNSWKRTIVQCSAKLIWAQWKVKYGNTFWEIRNVVLPSVKLVTVFWRLIKARLSLTNI